MSILRMMFPFSSYFRKRFAVPRQGLWGNRRRAKPPQLFDRRNFHHFVNQPPVAWIGVGLFARVIQAASAPILSGLDFSILNFTSLDSASVAAFCTQSTTKSCESFRPLFSPAFTFDAKSKPRPARYAW